MSKLRELSNLFQISDEEKEEIKQRSIAKQKAMGIPDMPEEKGIEELEFEEALPGGQFLGMLSPTGLGKKGAKAGAKGLKKLLSEGVPSDVDTGFYRQIYDIDVKPGVINYKKKLK